MSIQILHYYIRYKMTTQEKILAIVRENPKSIRELAKEIKIDYLTLRLFLKDTNHVLKFKTQLLVEKWIRENEKALEK